MKKETGNKDGLGGGGSDLAVTGVSLKRRTVARDAKHLDNTFDENDKQKQSSKKGLMIARAVL